jgi:serine phosphatase RsbU (regulator of sigma subunit)/anti-sigma regulatory factor (Ser/Thr protein kinase)
MGALLRKSWLSLRRKPLPDTAPARLPEEKASQEKASQEKALPRGEMLEIDLAPDDPLLETLIQAPGVVEVDRLRIDSPGLRELQTQGVKMIVPLVSQGELIGVLNLGPRLSEQEYSTDDLRLIGSLATQAAPALRVAQLARQQQIEARERERIEQELRVARVIQQTLLPKEMPDLPGWQLSAYWQPARSVSGDFYDFITFPDGTLGLIVGDVTDKGVGAALVMATTRSVLRTVAERLVSPGLVLERANDLLCPDMPKNMFCTCLYALLDPASGCLRYANAGHNLPYQRTREGVKELRATGMPLGLMPGMTYEEKEAVLETGDCIILYSDGLVEAHNEEGEIFGFPMLRELLGESRNGAETIEFLLEKLAEFTGPDWVQEDDVTFVTLDHVEIIMGHPTPFQSNGQAAGEQAWQTLAEFSFPSLPGTERQAMEQVAAVFEQTDLPKEKLERFKTAVAEGILNAMEHGNSFRPDLMAEVKVLLSNEAVMVQITDYGGGKEIPISHTPDLEAKLAGLQSPRGWGLFIIKNMVDDMRLVSDEVHHTIELVMHRKATGVVSDPAQESQ